MNKLLFFLVGLIAIIILILFMPLPQGGQKALTNLEFSADDGPSVNGYYAYIRFDSDAGPFAKRDLPEIYLDKSKRTTNCFSGRIEGQTIHTVVFIDQGLVTTREGASLDDWTLSECADALTYGSKVLTRREYMDMRLKILPNTPSGNEARTNFEAQHMN